MTNGVTSLDNNFPFCYRIHNYSEERKVLKVIISIIITSISIIGGNNAFSRYAG